jgi:hypothetical protein
MKKPLMKKPVGPSKLGHGFGTDWNNQSRGTTGAVVCEICGTKHPEIDDSEPTRTISRFMGYQVVEECCGAVIDHVYRELGEEFAIAFIEEFANNPADFKYHILLVTIKEAMKKAAKKLDEVSGQVAEISEAVQAIGES